MFGTLALFAALLSGSQPPLHCPVTFDAIKGAPSGIVDLAGVRYETCCAPCAAAFSKNPQKWIDLAMESKETVGQFDFDPVSGLRIDAKDAVGYSDYLSVRYLFATKDEKKQFDADPGHFIKPVKMEAYYCPVMDQPTSYKDAASYEDWNGVRYFLCCSVCVKKFRQDPLKYEAIGKKAAKEISPIKIKG